MLRTVGLTMVACGPVLILWDSVQTLERSAAIALGLSITGLFLFAATFVPLPTPSVARRARQAPLRRRQRHGQSEGPKRD
ncbi:MAG: hypothetical protein ACT4QC_22330 [Planctomycetaceae bacterium]